MCLSNPAGLQTKIETLYALEPEQALSKILAENIVKNGFADKSLLIPVGIDDRNKLSTYGVSENTFDTIVLVQVCCSLPNASAHFKYLQSLLKPGGKLIMFEHVASADPITRLLQDLYTFAFWKRAALGCEVGLIISNNENILKTPSSIAHLDCG